MFFGIADYPAFALAILIFLLIPGPGNLALVTSTGKGGIRAGLAAGMAIAALGFAYCLVLVTLTHNLAERLRAMPRLGRTRERLVGIFLIGFGIKLAVSR
ncbi:MAG: hypothetical protein EXR34_13250 [Rhodoferax sp.]|nr:hypothetical protein [Rhodoferax sp.]